MKKAVVTLVIGSMMTITAAASAFAAEATAERAKETALKAADVKAEDVVVTKNVTDIDDGREIFEVDFVIPGEVKYEFDIDAATGEILDRDMDLWDAEDDMEYAYLLGENAAAGETKDGQTSEITELQAKTAALKDAGFLASEVSFTKCRMDVDDGITRFEIEFIGPDGVEYNYDINVENGSILEKDLDTPDYDFDDMDDAFDDFD